MNLLREERKMVRSAISEKFGNHIVMTCKKINAEKQYSIWYAVVTCLKANHDQLIACVLPLEKSTTIDEQQYLSDLHWTSFQTRTSKDQNLLNSLSIQNCPIRGSTSELSSQVLETKFEQVPNSNPTISCTYLSQQLPSVRIDLLIDNTTPTWRKEGSLDSCLNTFQCLLEFQI